jgi:glycosyltransferase involved in cell wall biosynthesis
MPRPATPRIGLICGENEGVGGLILSQNKHPRLLAGAVDVVSICLAKSMNESDHCGRIRKSCTDGLTSYEISAAKLMTDAHLRGAEDDHLHHTYAEAIVEIAKTERLGAIHVFGAYGNAALIGAFAAARTGLPLILSFRGADLGMRLFGSTFAGTSRAIAIASACICLNSEAAMLLRNLFRPSCPIHVIPNHIDVERFAVPSVSPPPLPPGKTIGLVAEFRRVTGLDYLLDAFAQLSTARELNLCLIGPIRKSEAIFYNGVLDRHPNAARIIRTGKVPHAHISAWLHACDVLVFPSLWEGSPNKVLEAMACARPIVAARGPGITETIHDGRDGVLVATRDAAALARAIGELLDDPERAQQLGTSAQERVRTQFTAEIERGRWLHVVDELLDANSTSPLGG